MRNGRSRLNTNLKFLNEIYTQLRQSVNTNTIERTGFLSVYIAMVTIVVAQILKPDDLFSRNNIILYAVFIGITFISIILMIKIDYMIFERNFLANQIVRKYDKTVYLESFPKYVNLMSIGFFIVLLMIVFLSISIYGLLMCLECFSMSNRIVYSILLCTVLTGLYILYRVKVKAYVTRKRFLN